MPLINIEEPIKDSSNFKDNEDEDFAVGIDLGTTNSLIAIKRGDKIEVIPDKNGNLMQPSIVGFSEEGQMKFSHQCLDDDDFTKIYSIKRLINENDFKNVNNKVIKNFSHEVTKNKGQDLKIKIFEREFTPIQISSYLLGYLKEIAESYLKKEVKKAVITVPAYFDEAARNATKNAATLAGLEVLRLINEPTAASIAYGLDNDSRGVFVVFDLGGGTFDISILKLSQGVFNVSGVSGDSSMGGDDIDYIITEDIIEKCSILEINNKTKLKLIAKNIKEKLSKFDNIEEEFEILGQKYQYHLKKEDFYKLITNFVDKTIKITQDLILELEVDENAIKGIILVGGSTRLELIKNKLADNFGKDKILTNLDPDKIVAVGAAIQAHGLTNNSSNLLLDVVPLSLGIETMGGIIDKIIERNTTIPTSYSKEFTTYQDNQTGMKFHILQGERELVENCRSLAKFEIKGIPSLKAGIARVKVTFNIDVDGLLIVKAEEQITKTQQIVEIKPNFGLTDLEAKKMLINSFQNAKSDIQKRLILEEKSEAKRNILAINSALNEDGNLLSNKQINNIKNQIEVLEKALDQDDRNKTEIEIKKLENLAKEFAQIKMDKYIKEVLVNKKVDEI